MADLAPLTDSFLPTIIAQLRTYCPSLAGRVGGAAAYKEAVTLAETSTLAVPCAWVIPLDDDAERMSQNGVHQRVIDHFGVVVALSNRADERGQAAATDGFGLRLELWRALCGFVPSGEYRGVFYEGSTLLKLDRARLFRQFEFGAEREINLADTWQYLHQSDPDAFPPLEEFHIDVDDIDPAADRNLQYPGPDGRIEFSLDLSPDQP